MHKQKRIIKKNKIAQASTEFILVFSVVTIFVVAFLITIYLHTRQSYIKNDQESVEDITNFIQQEIMLASKVEDGYNRTFFLPETINNKVYSIAAKNYSIKINSTGQAFAICGIPIINEPEQISFNYGKANTIIKNETGIYINPA